MLKDARPKSFAGIYIVCGYTDMRYGIDSLAAIVEHRYKMKLFVPNTLFLFRKIRFQNQRISLGMGWFPSSHQTSGLRPLLLAA
jgi:hypothetical protein